jgi:hypothetical protein
MEVGEVSKTGLLGEEQEQRDLCLIIKDVTSILCVLQEALELLTLGRWITAILKFELMKDLVRRDSLI